MAEVSEQEEVDERSQEVGIEPNVPEMISLTSDVDIVRASYSSYFVGTSIRFGQFLDGHGEEVLFLFGIVIGFLVQHAFAAFDIRR